jgi:ribosome-associated protein
LAKRKKQPESQGRRLAVEAARLCALNHCEEILVLDLREVSPVTDYFVIATGTSGRQLRSVSQDLQQRGKELAMRVWQVAGEDSAQWVLLDFVDVVVHLFDQEHRHYYDLELIWGDAPRVSWQDDSPEPRAVAEDEDKGAPGE